MARGQGPATFLSPETRPREARTLRFFLTSADCAEKDGQASPAVCFIGDLNVAAPWTSVADRVGYRFTSPIIFG